MLLEDSERLSKMSLGTGEREEETEKTAWGKDMCSNQIWAFYPYSVLA